MYLGTYGIDEYLPIPAVTHRFSTGAAYAPTAITYSIYEEGATTGIAEDTDMTPASPFDSVTGLYYARVQLTSAAGYEANKTYVVVVKATVDSVAAIEAHVFQIRPLQTGDSYAIVNSGTYGNAALKTLIDIVDNFIDTEVAAILADTNELQTDLVNGGRLDLLIDSIITHLTDLKGDTFNGATDSNEAIRNRGDAAWVTATGFSTLDAPGVRTAVGLASANLDTQLADIPTVTEMNNRTKPTADYFNPATDTVARVTLVDTTTTNTDMRGTNDAALATVCTEARLSELDAETAGKMANQVDVIQTDTTTDIPALIGALPSADAVKTAMEAAGSHLTLIKAVTDALTSAAAGKLAISAGTIVAGTVAATASSTTVFYSDDITEATADHFCGRVIIFTSGALQYQATKIEDYELAGGEGKFLVTALTEAPANDTNFIIV